MRHPRLRLWLAQCELNKCQRTVTVKTTQRGICCHRLYRIKERRIERASRPLRNLLKISCSWKISGKIMTVCLAAWLSGMI